MRRAVAGCLVVLSAALPRVVVAQSVTVGAPGGSNTGWGHQAGFEYAVGETFKTPDATHLQLDSWSYWIAAQNVPGFQFQVQVFQFLGGATVGPAIYTSAMQTANTVGPQTYDKFTFAINKVLNSGLTYIAIANPANGFGWIDTYCGTGCNLADPYPAGNEASGTSNGGVDPALYTTSSFFDLRFEATFSDPNPVVATPEPASLGLMATGLLGIAGVARRRRVVR